MSYVQCCCVYNLWGLHVSVLKISEDAAVMCVRSYHFIIWIRPDNMPHSNMFMLASCLYQLTDNNTMFQLFPNCTSSFITMISGCTANTIMTQHMSSAVLRKNFDTFWSYWIQGRGFNVHRSGTSYRLNRWVSSRLKICGYKNLSSCFLIQKCVSDA